MKSLLSDIETEVCGASRCKCPTNMCTDASESKIGAWIWSTDISIVCWYKENSTRNSRLNHKEKHIGSRATTYGHAGCTLQPHQVVLEIKRPVNWEQNAMTPAFKRRHIRALKKGRNGLRGMKTIRKLKCFTQWITAMMMLFAFDCK